MTQPLGRRPLTTEGRVRSQNNPRFVVDKLVSGQVSFRGLSLSSVGIISSVLHTP